MGARFDIGLELTLAAASWCLSAALFPIYISWLKQKQIGQYLREDGPASHAGKAKTPTMGGLCFIAVSSVTALIWLAAEGATTQVEQYPASAYLSVIVIAACCGLVGFIDDYGKVTSRSNRGISARVRLLVEFLLGAVFALVLFCLHAMPLPGQTCHLDVSLSSVLDPAYLIIFVPFLVVATTNAVNLHDGMDGLAGGTSLQIFAVLAVMLTVVGNFALAGIAVAGAGALAGFLMYNIYPAKVFMGDTGSLYIGGLLACLVVAGGLWMWFIPLSVIYISEALSVIVQVVYFKLTKPYTRPLSPDKPISPTALIWLKLTTRLPGEGKRLLRMAPLHHHFEALAIDAGIPEWQIVACFWLVQFLISAAVLFAYLYYTVG